MLSIVVLALCFSGEIVKGYLFLIGELLWVGLAFYVRLGYTPYAGVMGVRIGVGFGVVFGIFVVGSFALFQKGFPEFKDKVITTVWLIDVILYLPVIVTLCQILSKAIQIRGLSKEIRKLEKANLKPFTVGRLSTHFKSKTKK